MDLAETYSRLRRSIIAFLPKVFPAQRDGSAPQMPPIFGTGYVIHEDGIIATNRHVVDVFKRFAHRPGDEEGSWPVYAMLLHKIDEGLVEIPLEILGVGGITSFEPDEFYYGPTEPDIAIVHVKARGLPTVTVDGDIEVREGMRVATAGFPMGSDLLMAPGWLHQISPTLQQGIVSAVHPFATPTPHGFSLNIMVQSGASGSPVFIPETGAVIGTVYASVGEPSSVWETTNGGQKKHIGFVKLPTVFSYAVPSHYLSIYLANFHDKIEYRPPQDAQTIDEMIAGVELVNRFRGDTVYKPFSDDDIEPQLTIRRPHRNK